MAQWLKLHEPQIPGLTTGQCAVSCGWLPVVIAMFSFDWTVILAFCSAYVWECQEALELSGMACLSHGQKCPYSYIRIGLKMMIRLWRKCLHWSVSKLQVYRSLGRWTKHRRTIISLIQSRHVWGLRPHTYPKLVRIFWVRVSWVPIKSRVHESVWASCPGRDSSA